MNNELYSNELYYVTIQEVLDPAFQHRDVKVDAYVVVNKETSLVEKESFQLPTAINFAKGMAEAMQEIYQEEAQGNLLQEVEKKVLN